MSRFHTGPVRFPPVDSRPGPVITRPMTNDEWRRYGPPRPSTPSAPRPKHAVQEVVTTMSDTAPVAAPAARSPQAERPRAPSFNARSGSDPDGARASRHPGPNDRPTVRSAVVHSEVLHTPSGDACGSGGAILSPLATRPHGPLGCRAGAGSLASAGSLVGRGPSRRGVLFSGRGASP
jgi:hypothetical protein